MTRKQILDEYPEAELLFADGLDAAIIGVGHRCGEPEVICYDVSRVLKILEKRDGMTPDEAVEFFEFNIAGAYVGPLTPVWVYR